MGAGEVVEIGLGLLRGHPRNANVMGAGRLRKLERQIGRTGRYEPLVVRRHPTEAGAYEMINGHHRKKVLERLGYSHAACLVWELEDAEALMLLATCNRLSGEDLPGKRLELLKGVEAGFGSRLGVEELGRLLPEDEGILRRLLERGVPALPRAAPMMSGMAVAFTVFLKVEEKERLVRELRRTGKEMGEALMGWCVRMTNERGGEG